MFNIGGNRFIEWIFNAVVTGEKIAMATAR